MRTPITLDDTLIWLNGRVGEFAQAAIMVEAGGFSCSVLEGEGILQHWRKAFSSAADAVRPREDVAGWYRVGETSLDLTGLDSTATFWRHDDPQMVELELADDVRIEIAVRPLLGGNESNWSGLHGRRNRRGALDGP